MATTDTRLWKGLPCPVLHSSWVSVGLFFLVVQNFFFFFNAKKHSESNFDSILTDGPALSFCSSVHSHKGVREPRPHSINTCSFPRGDVRPQSTKQYSTLCKGDSHAPVPPVHPHPHTSTHSPPTPTIHTPSTHDPSTCPPVYPPICTH